MNEEELTEEEKKERLLWDWWLPDEDRDKLQDEERGNGDRESGQQT